VSRFEIISRGPVSGFIFTQRGCYFYQKRFNSQGGKLIISNIDEWRHVDDKEEGPVITQLRDILSRKAERTRREEYGTRQEEYGTRREGFENPNEIFPIVSHVGIVRTNLGDDGLINIEGITLYDEIFNPIPGSEYTIVMSSVWNDDHAKFAVNGSLIHTKDEYFPFIMIKLNTPRRISGTVITNRQIWNMDSLINCQYFMIVDKMFYRTETITRQQNEYIYTSELKNYIKVNVDAEGVDEAPEYRIMRRSTDFRITNYPKIWGVLIGINTSVPKLVNIGKVTVNDINGNPITNTNQTSLVLSSAWDYNHLSNGNKLATKEEPFPFIAIKFKNPRQISSVGISARRDDSDSNSKSWIQDQVAVYVLLEDNKFYMLRRDFGTIATKNRDYIVLGGTVVQPEPYLLTKARLLARFGKLYSWVSYMPYAIGKTGVRTHSGSDPPQYFCSAHPAGRAREGGKTGNGVEDNTCTLNNNDRTRENAFILQNDYGVTPYISSDIPVENSVTDPSGGRTNCVGRWPYNGGTVAGGGTINGPHCFSNMWGSTYSTASAGAVRRLIRDD
jgi:hypothetical protein